MKQVKTRTQPRKRLNIWKIVALVLIGLIIGSGAWFAHAVLTPVDQPTTQEATIKGEPVMTVSLTKRQVNQIVTYFLNDFQKGSQVKYTLTLADQAVVGGTFKFFGQKIHFGLLMDPLVRKNGDVELKARQLNVGSLPVPISYVMNYASRAFKLPQWVTLNSKRKTIVLELNKFKMASGMQIKANKIDLPNDQMNFSVYLPKQALK